MKNNYFIGSALLALAAITTTAYAQASYQPGYVVTLAGDTVRGQVQEVSARRNSVLCRFRPAATGPITDYAPASLRAYGIVHGATYRARAVPPADPAAGASAPQQLFLEVLVPGPAQLYSSRDQPGHTRYFVAVGAPGARLRELAERREKTFGNGPDTYETRSLYRDTLAAALRACPAVQVQLPQLSFQQAALARVITQYNACVGGPAAVAAPPPARRPGAVLSVLAGYQAGTMKLSGGDSFFQLAPPLHQASPVAGLGLTLALPHTRRTMSVRLEATYAHEVYDGEYAGIPNTAALPTQRVNNYHFDLQYIHVPIMLRYTLMRSPRLRPFIEAGGVYHRLWQTKSTFSVQTGTGALVSLPYFAEGDVQYNQFGLQAGAGLSVPVIGERRLALLARVATSNGLSNYTGVASPITYFSVLLGLDVSKP
ncbi:outer membrane beta-barrel protein [Hymenobacter cheonanensis]|uniref:outer membrane beta-barrel protein n=1 Tax=Hymenobacter sp. CA2-7 TaxID=3063993 RepID=UPI0027122BF6|nr:outer membrane beta-barrel protein [Hymenobacter sp. CA2-7]MDO7886892.1 outer membrane beta-barrel protein [Hymenobacter sp. CA2-7]